MKRILPAILALLWTQSISAQTWTQLPAPGPHDLLGCWVDGADPNHAVATGFYVQAWDLIPFVYTTTDGGAYWLFQTPAFGLTFLASRAVAFTSSTTGFLAGGGVVRTLDGGSSWDLVADVFTVGGQLYDIRFPSATHGYAVGEPWSGTGGLFCTTINSGGSWTCGNISDPVLPVAPQLTSLARPSDTLMLAAGVAGAPGDRTVLRSTDDGATWTATGLTENVYSLWFTSASAGCAGTETGILRTTDGGATWSPVLTTAATVSSIRIEQGLGFAVAVDGSIWRTLDAGAAWSPMTSPVQGTRILNDLVIVSPQLAWACGSAGTLLEYTGPPPAVFADGFETGDTSVWSAVVP